jgi:hypothetical protein
MLEEIYKFLLSMIGPNHFHVWSLIVYATFCLFVFIKLVKYIHPIYAFMLSYVIGMLGNNLYESLWQYIMYENGINSYFMQYIVVDIGIIILLIACNYVFKFIHINKWVIILCVLELTTFYLLAVTGHYDALRVWIQNGYQGPVDPHNWLWMINKALGVWFLYPLVLSKEQHKERIK